MRLRSIALLLLLAACSDVPSDAARAERKAKRQAAAAAHVAKPPSVQAHELTGGSLLVINVPVVDGFGGTESQQCFVWRDTAFKTSSMTCPSREVVITP